MTIRVLSILLLFLGSLFGHYFNQGNDISYDISLFHGNSTSQSLKSTMVNNTRRQTAAALRQVRMEEEKKRLMSKKTRAEEKKAEEEAAKAKARTEAQAKKTAEANSIAAKDNTVSPDTLTTDKPENNINELLSAVNNPNKDNEDDVSSPVKIKRKTRHTSLKSAIKNPNADPLAGHLHVFRQYLILAGIVITGSNDKERVQHLVRMMRQLVDEMQSIDETVRLNHLYNQTVSLFKSESIPENQTKFGCLFNVSSFGNKNPFGKQRVYNNKKKKKNDEAEWKDPTIYLQFSISSDMDPNFILERVRGQWFVMEGTKLEVKEIQELNVVTTHMAFNLSCTNDRQVLNYELRNMMEEVRKINEEDGIHEDPFPFRDIPKFTLTSKIPRLTGIDTKSLNSKLSYEELNHRRCIHIECAAKDAGHIRWLVSKLKTVTRLEEEKPVIEIFWGRHILLTEVLESGKTSPGEIKNMNKMSQYHGNYSTSMCHDNLVGASNLDTKVVLFHCDEKNLTLYITLREVLLTLVAYPSDDDKEKEHRLFAEVHQGGNPGDIVTVVYPNTPAAESLVMNMNKNFAVILKSILIAQCIKSDVINELLRTSVCPTHVAQMSNFTYDEKSRTLTSLKDNSQDKALEELSKAPWFQNKFDMNVLLNDKKKAKEDGPPPELLFNIDGERSLKTIHDKPREPNKAKEATKEKSKIVFNLDSSSDSSSNKSENDDSSASSSLAGGASKEGSTPSLSSSRSNSTAPEVTDQAVSLGNAQDSTMSG